jgi:hypothetical protein
MVFFCGSTVKWVGVLRPVFALLRWCLLGEFAIGELCAGECAKTIDGIFYTCPKCHLHYCFTCSYYTRWKCPKCGERLA